MKAQADGRATTGDDVPSPPGTVPDPSSGQGRFYRLYILTLLCLTFFLSYADRQVFGVVLTPIKQEFGLSDTELGLMSGLAFGLFYSILSLPLARLADRTSRKWVLTVCLALWSGATMAGGAATSALHLLLARMGVGVGEAGGTPASVSAISDLFPRASRGTALALYNAAGSLGGALVIGVGAWVASVHGWRTAFVIIGLPGVLLSLLIAVTMREPVRGAADGKAVSGDHPTLRETLRYIWRQPALILAIFAGGASSAVVSNTIWLPSLFQRIYGLSLAEAGGAVGLALLLAGPFGEIIGGQISDRLGRTGPAPVLRAVGGVSAMTVLLGVAMLMSPIVVVAIGVMVLWKIFATVFPPPTWELSQSLVEVRMRATSQAVMGIVSNLAGYGCGPAMTGFFSELYRPHFGDQALRWALCTTFILFGSLAALLYMLAARRAASAQVGVSQ